MNIMVWNCSTGYKKGAIVIFNGEKMVIGEHGVNNLPITIEEFARREGLKEVEC